ncbi:glycosyltransferase [Nocardioides exalbidus]|uniref:glycosyltransferase n=1 Tax=Nocardioides exalbidus TaxID=402596 RepID=UPI000A7F153A|nr:glycosyltransferase [Nocardioides exalbidus]
MSAAEVLSDAQPAHDRGPRVGVLVVAYNAASTLERTLSRLPESFARSVDHVMVCDDASQDDTYEIGLRFRDTASFPITVVKHARNLGYGGNQKAGYRWAVEHGLDVVVLLHGDGQYAPECVEDLVTPLVRGEADAVFGSRMLEKGGAMAGGMPAYKYAGNKILTGLQNALTGQHLSEWHSGYRAYRTDALTDLDLASYSDDFDFDTEIILGLIRAGKRIAEVPIPTYYGDEICYVNGMKYARDVTADVVRHWASERGFGGGVASTETDLYALKATGSHGVLIEWLQSREPSRVLDAGCFDGRFADLARRAGHHVTGLDRLKHDGVADRVDSFIEADLNQPLPPPSAQTTTWSLLATSSSTS